MDELLTARDQLEGLRGQLDGTAAASAEELLRSIQGVGPRRYPGGGNAGFEWQEPTVKANGDGTLSLCWVKGSRHVTVRTRPNDSTTLDLVRGSTNVGTQSGGEVGFSVAADEVVQFLMGGR